MESLQSSIAEPAGEAAGTGGCDAGIMRRCTLVLVSCPGVPGGNERNAIHLPSGEGWGNQSSWASLVMRSALLSFGPAPSAGKRQISQPPGQMSGLLER